MKFKVGDKVRCNKTGIYHPIAFKNIIYTVCEPIEEGLISLYEMKQDRYNLHSEDRFELVNDLEILIDTANKGLEAIFVLCNEHSDNEKLYYTYAGFDGATVKFKLAYLMRQGKPAHVFLKEEPKFNLGGVNYSLVEAKEMKRKIDSFLEENE